MGSIMNPSTHPEYFGAQPISTAPRDGTHILARIYREKSEDMDGRRWKAFTEVREIWFKPYTDPCFGMDLPWHAGDPFDTADELGDEHMGEGVPTHWWPMNALHARHAPAQREEAP